MIVTRSGYATRAKSIRAVKGAVVTSRAVQFPSNSSPFARFHFLTAAGRMGLWWLVGLTLIWSALLLTALPAGAQSFQIFVPSITTDGSAYTGVSDDDPPGECLLNAEEETVASMIVGHPEQHRDHPVCNPILAEVARARARDMALRDYFGHVNPDGDGPNLLARQAGYPLPDWYGSDQGSNNIESISAGQQSAKEAFQTWINSPDHRTHVLGTEQFYADQEAYGVGYYFNPDSTYGHYWVFVSAPIADE